MTGEEFEAAYAARSGVSTGWLHSAGRYAEPCDCGEPECEGWAMGHQQDDAIIEDVIVARAKRRDVVAVPYEVAVDLGWI